jgi:hypothetical protein
MGDMLDYLPAEEETIGKHRIGGYDVVTTSDRVIFLKKFPPTFLEVFFSEVSGLEHKKDAEWKELAIGSILILLAVTVYVISGSGFLAEGIGSFVRGNLPDLADVFPSDFVVMVIILVFATVGIYYVGSFLASLKGHFRILRKGRTPVSIPIPMNQELKTLMEEIDKLVKQKTTGGITPVLQPMEQSESPKELRDRLNATLDGIGECKVVLISSKSENHSVVVSNMLDILVNERDMGGVYVSITKPYDFIRQAMQGANTPSNDMYFIDCISLMAGKAQQERRENVVFVENPSSLEEVSMYVDRMLGRVKKPKKFLFIDSLSSLLIYNSTESVQEFTHSIINKIRLDNIIGVIFTIDKREADDLLKTLAPMCDKEVRF